MRTGIDQAETKFIEEYADRVHKMYGNLFASSGNQFIGACRLLAEFQKAVTAVLSNNDRSLISQIDDRHNELCIATALLASTEPGFAILEYEPELADCDKKIDFRATTHEQQILFVEVKTIHPDPKDRWDQYQKFLEDNLFPRNVHVGLSRDWLGGELWHNMYAARGNMMKHAVGLETTIRDCNLADDNVSFCLALCGEGYYWTEDSLQDFVAFYRTGTHRSDDPFLSPRCTT